jgi:hypothetical protein
MQLGSMFISNCKITLHVSGDFCVHPQEYLKTNKHTAKLHRVGSLYILKGVFFGTVVFLYVVTVLCHGASLFQDKFLSCIRGVLSSNFPLHYCHKAVPHII